MGDWCSDDLPCDRMKTNYCPSCKGYADRIAALEAENVRLVELLTDGLEIVCDQLPGEFPAFVTDAKQALGLGVR